MSNYHLNWMCSKWVENTGKPCLLYTSKQGKFSATLGVDPYRMGVTVTDTMDKVLAGQEVPQVILTPSVVVTPENLQDYLDGKLWTDPVAGSAETDNDQPTVPD